MRNCCGVVCAVEGQSRSADHFVVKLPSRPQRTRGAVERVWAGVGCKFMGITTTMPLMRMTSYFCGVRGVRKLVQRTSRGNIRVVTFPRLSIANCAYLSLFTRRALLSNTRTTLLRLIDGATSLSVLAVINIPLQARGQLVGTTIIFRGKTVQNIIPGACLPGCGRFRRRH